ncbi:MAG: undecaprenyldiphospho-muramoylpentapeptide beta-N-acetylglucosaminyltransferase [Bacteroidales bacterium]|nr:undecaprenyldiphospho-muramoylpentapeptide beta-N-acetylglucosaminyltransferase [Bacteroidales bacterium]
MRVIISGGGTGGHIFPAIAIANAIKEKYVDCEIMFIGARDRMEMQKVPEAGYKIEGLNISGFNRQNMLKNFSLPFKLIGCLLKAKRILRMFKPDVVIGVGGYASAAALYVASSLHIPTIIQEQNSFPGITNKILAKRVNRICVAYSGMDKWFPKGKIVMCGNPVRQSISNSEANSNKQYSKAILVVGGSLGALTINESIARNLDFFVKNDMHLVWQTGKYYYERAKQQTSSLNTDNIKAYEFIKEMDKAYAEADYIISRAGALAISELAIVGKPVILVPSPNVAEDHQTKNAMALSTKDAALLVADSEARANLIPTLKNLINNPVLCSTLKTNIASFAVRDADKKIVEQIEQYLK